MAIYPEVSHFSSLPGGPIHTFRAPKILRSNIYILEECRASNFKALKL